MVIISPRVGKTWRILVPGWVGWLTVPRLEFRNQLAVSQSITLPRGNSLQSVVWKYSVREEVES